MEIQQIPSAINPDQHQVGLVHIGLGAFHRGHQAVYLEKTLAQHGGDWMIASANIRSNYQLVEQLEAANYCYPVVEYTDSQHLVVREIKAIKQAFFAGNQAERQQLLAQMSTASTKIVTLTVTEKGYYLSPSSGDLLLDNPAIVYDIEHPDAPKTALGLIVNALKQRCSQGTPAFTVLSCDNMPHNGIRTKNAVLGLARAQDASLAAWIEAQVAFPSSMVDRIVPALSADDLQKIEADTGITTPTVVKCEAFCQWVVEENFPTGRPQWECAGVQMVADVSTYETMKLRMLNGSHSLLAYLGQLAGYQSVAQAMQNNDIRKFLEHYMQQEVAPTLTACKAEELLSYSQQLLTRFENDSLQHQLSQIAMDGSQKLPQRWLSGLIEQQQKQASSAATELGIAGWLFYIQQAALQKTPINDPLEAELFALVLAQYSNSFELISECLSQQDVFPPSMTTNSALITRLAALFDALQAKEDLLEMMRNACKSTDNNH
ncbi:mannitol dehydrogenase family protein [Marinomonas arenicola]|uniref:mannitol dehydrogenase family protein n=1 Tax=Marinomonas arenicola TaxID=569601 RepID=UPI00311FA0A3